MQSYDSDPVLIEELFVESSNIFRPDPEKTIRIPLKTTSLATERTTFSAHKQFLIIIVEELIPQQTSIPKRCEGEGNIKNSNCRYYFSEETYACFEELMNSNFDVPSYQKKSFMISFMHATGLALLLYLIISILSSIIDVVRSSQKEIKLTIIAVCGFSSIILLSVFFLATKGRQVGVDPVISLNIGLFLLVVTAFFFTNNKWKKILAYILVCSLLIGIIALWIYAAISFNQEYDEMEQRLVEQKNITFDFQTISCTSQEIETPHYINSSSEYFDHQWFGCEEECHELCANSSIIIASLQGKTPSCLCTFST